jgi:uncharacterized protein YjiS (DUF1127 family)
MMDQTESPRNSKWDMFRPPLRLLSYVKTIREKVAAALQPSHTQRTLRQLDERLLRDIGIDPRQIGNRSDEAKQVLTRLSLGMPHRIRCKRNA